MCVYAFIKFFVNRDIISILYFLVAFIIEFSFSQNCTYINPCKCVFQNGSMIDLTNLGSSNGARWKNMTPTLTRDLYHYYYNPCFPFALGPENSECAKGVAVCQVINNNYFDCGEQNHAFFKWNSQHGHLNLIYKTSIKTTNVTLVCSADVIQPILVVKGEVHTNLYEMELTSMCACPDLCRSDHLSTGSILIIIFLIFISLYLILGVAYTSLILGAHGWEIIPNYEFWKDLPLLIRDGCIFVINGCKSETAYERI